MFISDRMSFRVKDPEPKMRGEGRFSSLSGFISVSVFVILRGWIDPGIRDGFFLVPIRLVMTVLALLLVLLLGLGVKDETRDGADRRLHVRRVLSKVQFRFDGIDVDADLCLRYDDGVMLLFLQCAVERWI
jgi:hypothetical protein